MLEGGLASGSEHNATADLKNSPYNLWYLKGAQA
jgi:hypothetical protein